MADDFGQKEQTGKTTDKEKNVDRAQLPDDKEKFSRQLLEEFLKKGPAVSTQDSPSIITIKKLIEERRQLEAGLSVDERKSLIELRMQLSKAPAEENAYAKTKKDIRAEMDTLFPQFAAINKKIDDELGTAKSLVEIADLKANSGTARRHSTIQCHNPAKGMESLPKFSLSLSGIQNLSKSHSDLPIVADKIDLEVLQREQQLWYEPFTRSCNLSRDYGVELSLSKDTVPAPYFSIRMNKVEHKLPVDMSLDQKEQLQQILERKLEDLKIKYGVEFSGEGEQILKPMNADSVLNGAAILPTRRPFIDELYGIEEAFKISATTLGLKNDGDPPLKISFMDEQNHLGLSTTAAGEYWRDLRERPTVVMYPGKQRYKVVNDAKDSLHTDLSVREIMIHELAHRHQDIMGWALMRPSDELAKEMGWQPVAVDKGSWILRCKDGEFYRYGDFKNPNWFRCNQSGDLLNASGNIVGDLNEAQKGKASEIRDLAVVRPPSSYFINPCEIYAEALTAFRSGSQWRSNLKRESPKLYELVKKQDQLEIDRYYKEKFTGKSGLRLPDGNVVEATTDAKEALVAYEIQDPKIPLPYRLIESMGWQKISGADPAQWIIKCKNNTFYRPQISAGEDSPLPWHRCDANGSYLDTAGKRVDKSEKSALSPSYEVRRNALVEPLSGNFSDPERMMAEAYKRFAGNSSSRADLLFTSKALYDVAQEYDRVVIAKEYSSLYPGKTFVRLPDGSITEKTKNAEERIKDFEAPINQSRESYGSEEFQNRCKDLHEALPKFTDWLQKENTVIGPEGEKKLLELDRFMSKLCPDVSNLVKKLEVQDVDRVMEQRALAAFLATRAIVKSNLATLYLEKGDKDKAYKFLEKACEGGYVAQLQLSNSFADDSILEAFSKLPTVSKVNLKDSQITDAGLKHLKQWSSLDYLMLGSPEVKGPGLAELAKLPDLSVLFLTNSAYDDAVLSHLPNLPTLSELEISGCSVTDKFLERIKDFPKLKRLSLPSGPSSDGLKYLADLPELQDLQLAGKSIDSASLVHLRTVLALEVLSLTGTGVSDQGLEHLQKLKKLKSLYLDDTAITDAGMQKLAGIKGLKEVALPENISANGVTTLLHGSRINSVYISGNKISEQEVADIKKSRPGVSITRLSSN